MKKIFFLLLILLLVFFYFAKKDIYKESVSKSPKKTKYSKSVKIALLADTHNNQQGLKKSLEESKNLKVNYVIVLGDFTDYSEVKYLKEQKQILDEANLDYCVVPGDHDIIGNNNKELNVEESNFFKIFENKICKLYIKKYNIAILINPYNYKTLNKEYLNNFYNLLSSDKISILITEQPIYNPKSNIYMGFFDQKVKEQAKEILKKLQNKEMIIVSADTHFFKKYKKDNLIFYNLGAITNKKNITKPNFAILEITDNNIKLYQKEIE